MIFLWLFILDILISGKIQASSPQEMRSLGVQVDKQAMLLKEYHISCPGSSTSLPLVSFSSVTHCEFICNTLSSINLSVLLLFQSCTLIQSPIPRLGLLACTESTVPSLSASTFASWSSLVLFWLSINFVSENEDIYSIYSHKRLYLQMLISHSW